MSLFLKESSKVPKFQGYMSGFVKGFLARTYPLTLSNNIFIYILIILELWNFLLLSMPYEPFAWNFFGTSGTFFYFQILRRVELLSLLVSKLSGSYPKYNLVISYG